MYVYYSMKQAIPPYKAHDSFDRMRHKACVFVSPKTWPPGHTISAKCLWVEILRERFPQLLKGSSVNSIFVHPLTRSHIAQSSVWGFYVNCRSKVFLFGYHHDQVKDPWPWNESILNPGTRSEWGFKNLTTYVNPHSSSHITGRWI